MYAKTRSLQHFSMPTANLCMDPYASPSDVAATMPSLKPVLRFLPAGTIKQVEQLNPRMVAILTVTGRLLIVNADSMDAVL